jgi:hypothetical protein
MQSCLVNKPFFYRVHKVVKQRTSIVIAKPITRRSIVVKNDVVDSLNSIATSSYFVSKGIILFTLFYCSMNWWHYRRLREDEETKDNNKK